MERGVVVRYCLNDMLFVDRQKHAICWCAAWFFDGFLSADQMNVSNHSGTDHSALQLSKSSSLIINAK
jgi:hypothetical protein